MAIVMHRDRIRDIRTGLGLTQAAMAALVGVESHTIYMWEKGRQAPTGAALRLLTLIEEGKVTP